MNREPLLRAFVVAVAAVAAAVPALAAESPLDVRQGGDLPASTPAAPGLARAGNVLFAMPDGWRRSDQPGGMIAIAPPSFPQGQWLEVRFLAPEPRNGSARDHLDRALATLKRDNSACRELKPAASGKAADGAEAVLIPVAVQTARGAATLLVLCYADAGELVQPIVVATNNGTLYDQHSQAIVRLLDTVRFASSTTLVAGKPPLTQHTVYRVHDFLEWVLDVPLTEDQKEHIQAELVRSWNADNRSEIDGCAELLKVYDQVNQLDAAKRDFARQAIQAEALKAWRAGKDDIDRYLVAIYDAAHKPLAAGDPPLTRQVTDSVAELMYFMASEVDGGGTVTPTQEVKDRFAEQVAQTWAAASPETRKQTAAMPLVWAGVRAAWPELSADQRKALVAQFAGVEQVKQLAAQFGKMRQEAQAQAQAQARGGAAATAGTAGKTETPLELMRRVQQQHENYMMMSNMLYTSHQTKMAIIYNMGNGYEYRRR